jgi:ligand-binding sensor domain-containing protein/serine phosphatase RsbU (regulator of sigma subunit)
MNKLGQRIFVCCILFNLSFFLVQCVSENELNEEFVLAEEIDSSAYFLVLESGDTMPSGVPQKAIDNITWRDSVPKATSVPLAILPSYELKSNKDENFLVSVQQIGSPEIRTPGKDTFDLPKDTIITGDVQEVRFSTPIHALNPAYKDAAAFDFQFYNVDQNFLDTYAHCVFEDSRGDIWIGTEGSGAVKFDGRSFYKFSEEEGMLSPYVRTIIEDSKGNMWFGSSGGGVSKFDGNNFMHISEDHGLPYKKVVSIIEDSKGNMWFGTYGGGVSMFDGEHLITYSTEQGLSDEIVRQVTEDDQGNILIGTRNGLNVFDGESFKIYNSESGFSNNIVWTVEQLSDGEIWLGTGKGINVWKNDSIYSFSDKFGATSTLAESIIEDTEGNIWIASRSSGLVKYDGKSITKYGDEEGIPEENLTDVFQSKNGDFWMSFWGAGFGRADMKNLEHFSEDRGLKNQKAFAMALDSNDNIALATQAGVEIIKNNQVFNLSTEQGLGMNRVYDVLYDNTGKLWMGVYRHGVYVWDGKELLFIGKDQGLSADVARCFHQDQTGAMWVGTYGGGVNKITDSTITTYSEDEGLSSTYIMSITEENDGTIWLAGKNGISKFDGDSFTNYSKKEGISDLVGWCSFIDSKGNVWFGTSDGITIYDGVEFSQITVEDGICNEIVRSIEEDEDHNIWVTTDGGVNILTPKSEEENNLDFDIVSLGKLDGLKGLTHYLGSTAMTSDSKYLWLGGGSSVSRLDLQKFTVNVDTPLVDISRIDINQNFVDYRLLEYPDYARSLGLDENIGGTFESIHPFKNTPNSLTLPYEDNHLTFWFSGHEWNANHKINFSYTMEGLDDGWSELSTEYRADYRNIPHGTYTFKVKAIGEANVWSETNEFTFTILPPWYHTLWARSIYILLGVLLIFGFNKMRTRKLISRQKELESIVEERTQEVVEQKKAVEHQKVEIEQQHMMLEETHKEITDSIAYAKRIQEAILPSESQFKLELSDSFVFYEPKDVVAGDFYWLHKVKNQLLFAVADCTGHGVPGAMVSVVCHNALERSIAEFGLSEPNRILDKTRELVIKSFEDDEGDVKDGMDIALCGLSLTKSKTGTKTLKYSGANNNLYLIKDGELEVVKANRQPIGKYEGATPFEQHGIELKSGDLLYIFTDGFADQFGGEKGKKMKYKSFKDLIYQHKDEPMNVQHKKLKEAFDNWKGDFEQVDDVCVIGVRI